jgi:hypothetical protein
MGLLGSLSPLSTLEITDGVYIGGDLCGYIQRYTQTITWNEC